MKDSLTRGLGERELERMSGEVFARRFWLYLQDSLKVKVRTYLGLDTCSNHLAFLGLL